ncbi:MAG TPA: glycoside hydrolase family 20 zincin-like fold domain-containing protein, partial [Bacteroidia bacterium]|nr:glycoside hydrolase family 20 zincin-like fold domain-containing protein [Bacteroidia bacterium]
MKSVSSWLVLFFVLISMDNFAQDKTDNYALIPKPVSLTPGTGNFQLTTATGILVNSEQARKDANLFNAYLLEHYGFLLSVTQSSKEKKQCISIFRDTTDTKLVADGY